MVEEAREYLFMGYEHTMDGRIDNCRRVIEGQQELLRRVLYQQNRGNPCRICELEQKVDGHRASLWRANHRGWCPIPEIAELIEEETSADDQK
jgi:hypothetical protein